MARYNSSDSISYIPGEYSPQPQQRTSLYNDSHEYSVAPAYSHSHRGGYSGSQIDLRFDDHVPSRGALVRVPPPAATVIDVPIVEHEHHHLHHHIDHHIDHGDVSGRVAVSRPRLGAREYSYDDLDVLERRYPNGATVGERRHRHRHRHRSSTRRNRSDTRSSYTTSEVNLRTGYDDEMDDLTVIDVPPGTRRVYVNVDKTHNREHQQPYNHDVNWRREHGVRRSHGLGNELWTEITKDLVTREAIEDCDYAFEETEYFYYIFEYLDRDQIAELRELTEDIRHERVRDIEYQSIAGSATGAPRLLTRTPQMDFEDTRTEIVIEGRNRRDASHRRRYYY